jgi:hypothetical protein
MQKEVQRCRSLVGFVMLPRGEDIGWMQVAEGDDALFLKQFLVASRFQRRGTAPDCSKT